MLGYACTCRWLKDPERQIGHLLHSEVAEALAQQEKDDGSSADSGTLVQLARVEPSYLTLLALLSLDELIRAGRERSKGCSSGVTYMLLPPTELTSLREDQGKRARALLSSCSRERDKYKAESLGRLLLIELRYLGLVERLLFRGEGGRSAADVVAGIENAHLKFQRSSSIRGRKDCLW